MVSLIWLAVHPRSFKLAVPSSLERKENTALSLRLFPVLRSGLLFGPGRL